MLYLVDTVAIVLSMCFLLCQAAIKCYTEIHRVIIVLKLFSVPRDVKFSVSKPIFEVESTDLGFGRICL